MNYGDMTEVPPHFPFFMGQVSLPCSILLSHTTAVQSSSHLVSMIYPYWQAVVPTA